MKMRVALIRGDGIGPEVIDAAVRVLDKTSALFGHTIAYENVAAGGCSIDAYGVPLTKESLAQCKSCGAILLGAVAAQMGQRFPRNPPRKRAA
jgi:3-isopropylmalate dehydrogenase